MPPVVRRSITDRDAVPNTGHAPDTRAAQPALSRNSTPRPKQVTQLPKRPQLLVNFLALAAYLTHVIPPDRAFRAIAFGQSPSALFLRPPTISLRYWRDADRGGGRGTKAL